MLLKWWKIQVIFRFWSTVHTHKHTQANKRMESFTRTHPNEKHANDDKLFETLNKTAPFIFMLYIFSCESIRAMLFVLHEMHKNYLNNLCFVACI